MSGEWWGFIFLILIMKIPMVYLAGVVWYACKPPIPPEPAAKLVEAPDPESPCPWRLRRRELAGRRPPRPPARPLPRSPRVAQAYAKHE